MKRFLFRLVLFFVPILLALPVLDYFISRELRQSQKFAICEYPTWNALLDGTVNSEVVVYGSSRAWVHFDPKIISKKLKKTCFNLGINGHPFPLQHLRYKLLMAKNTKPQLIIQSLDVQTLTKLKDLYNLEQFLPYMLWNDDFMDATQNYNGFNFWDYKIPLVRYYGSLEALKEIRRIKSIPGANWARRYRGYEGQDRNWNNDFKDVLKKYKSARVVTDQETVKLFESWIVECQSENIKIVFVYPPEYIEGQGFITNRKQIIELYQKLASKYHIPFYNYSNDALSLDRRNFYNVTHLNIIGAQQFSTKLCERLKADPEFSDIFN